MRLRARQGRAELLSHASLTQRDATDHDMPPQAPRLSSDLTDALHEWAKITQVVIPSSGRSLGIESADLVSRRGRQLAIRVATELATPVDYLDPTRETVIQVEPRPAVEPTPWATGLTISAVTAIAVMITLFDLSNTLGQAGAWLALLGNVLVVCGLIPVIWLFKDVPTLRWLAFGFPIGMLLAWAALIIALLGPGSAA